MESPSTSILVLKVTSLNWTSSEALSVLTRTCLVSPQKSLISKNTTTRSQCGIHRVPSEGEAPGPTGWDQQTMPPPPYDQAGHGLHSPQNHQHNKRCYGISFYSDQVNHLSWEWSLEVLKLGPNSCWLSASWLRIHCGHLPLVPVPMSSQPW